METGRAEHQALSERGAKVTGFYRFRCGSDVVLRTWPGIGSEVLHTIIVQNLVLSPVLGRIGNAGVAEPIQRGKGLAIQNRAACTKILAERRAESVRETERA